MSSASWTSQSRMRSAAQLQRPRFVGDGLIRTAVDHRRSRAAGAEQRVVGPGRDQPVEMPPRREAEPDRFGVARGHIVPGQVPGRFRGRAQVTRLVASEAPPGLGIQMDNLLVVVELQPGPRLEPLRQPLGRAVTGPAMGQVGSRRDHVDGDQRAAC